MKDTQYINIQGWMINRLNLSGTRLILYAIIYGFSQDGESTFNGSLKYLQKATGNGRTAIMDNLKVLISKGIIEKNYEIKNGIKFNSYKTKPPVRNSAGVGTDSALRGGTDSGSNNTIKYTIENREDRKRSFHTKLLEFKNDYSDLMIKEFFEYWIEHGDDDKKMRFEKESTWGLSRRLSNWKKRENKFNGTDDEKPTTTSWKS